MSLLLLVKQNRNATLKAEHFDMSLGRRQVLKAGWWDAEELAVRLTLALILHPQARGKERLHSIQQDPEGYDQLRNPWVIQPKPGRRRTHAIQVRIVLKYSTESRPEKTDWLLQFPFWRNYRLLFFFFGGGKETIFTPHLFSLKDWLGWSLSCSDVRAVEREDRGSEAIRICRI